MQNTKENRYNVSDTTALYLNALKSLDTCEIDALEALERSYSFGEELGDFEAMAAELRDHVAAARKIINANMCVEIGLNLGKDNGTI